VKKKMEKFWKIGVESVSWIPVNLKGAIARENALLQIKPVRVVDECCEFE
jgi:hypothetical protein